MEPGIDLHMHSVHSLDGEFSVARLITLCRESGLDSIAITDHNTTAGLAEAVTLAAASGLNLIPGIEVDCIFWETDLHLLGYGIDWKASAFADLENEVRQKIMEVFPAMIENLSRHGITVDPAVVLNHAGGQLPSGELIAEVLLADPVHHENPLLKPYLPGGARSDMPYINFYRDFFAQGKPAYAPIRFMPFRQAVELIRDHGGIPVVAHPGANLAGREAVVEDLLDAGAMGLEVFNNYHDDRQAAFFAATAAGRKVLMTCGSDFHGKTKPLIRAGVFPFLRQYLPYLKTSLRQLHTC
jgi:3',5'-nucleoside bisphosphate phosphatase